MLISFSVENWRSFRDKAEFSMAATKERQFVRRLMTVSRRPKVIRLLPTSAIFGGNAAGKSNLINAIAQARAFIIQRSEIIGDNAIRLAIPFALDKRCASKPSAFAFSILVNVGGKEKVFDYSFSVTREAVVDERLVRSDFNGNECVIFDRNAETGELFSDSSESDRIKFVLRGTRKDRLFLSNAVEQNVRELEPIFHWFRDCLHIVRPESKYIPVNELSGADSLNAFGSLLGQYDTGIKSVRLDSIPSGAIGLEGNLPSGVMFRIDLGQGRICMASNNGGEVACRELRAMHRDADGSDIQFSFADESDGTRRLVDILPMMQTLLNTSGHVFIVDELDRSIHPNLMERMLQDYLTALGEDSRSQLIFTTHDTNLLDQQTLRRDESWIVERAADGSSNLCAISDFRLRKDADIRKGYLIGRFGGVPRV